MAVVVVGAYTLDLFMTVRRLPQPGETVNCLECAQSHGGKGANQAIASRRLGADVILITRIGTDFAGDGAYELFLNEQLNPSFVIRKAGDSTSISSIIVDQGGLQYITNYMSANAQPDLDQIREANSAIRSASVLLLQGEYSPEISFEAARLAGDDTLVVLDPSPADGFAGLPLFPRIDVLTPNEQEAGTLTGKQSPTARDVARTTGVKVVILTRGEQGVEVFWNDETFLLPSPGVNVVDTTGAGDAFNGAFAAAVDRGMDLRLAVLNACQYASRTVEKQFCIPSYPVLGEFKWITI